MKQRIARRELAPGRRQAYTIGLVLQGLGGLAFLIGFIGFASNGMRAASGGPQLGGNPFGSASPTPWWFVALGGMVVLAIGGFIRHVAARGIAGSGLVLDPKRARDDLEPFARAGGGLVRDALDEAGLLTQYAPRTASTATGEVVRIRCRECRALEDESAHFCSHCGAKL